MHELAVARNLVDAATAEAAKRGETKITALKLRLGRLCCVQEAPIRFCFELAAKGSPAEGAQLIIEEVEPEGECAACGACFPIAGAVFRCPACGAARTRVIKGTECALVELEVPE